jgi:F-type H+-transporting ATPase subunit delta
MSETRVARRYAQALFNVAKEGDTISAVETDLQGVAGVIERDESFREFLDSPKIGRDEKLRILETLFSDRITAVTMQALRLMLQKGRESLVLEVRDAYVRLRREFGNVLYAFVVSAEPLTDAQQKWLVEKLKKSTGKEVDADFKVDKALVGGIRVAYGNFVLDGSIRGGLRRLRDTLKYGLLKQA